LPDVSIDAENLYELHQLALEASGTGLWAWDVATDAVTWTRVCYTLVGADPGEGPLTFAGFLQRVHEDDREPLQAAVAATLSEGGVFEHSFRVILPDGSVRWLVNHGRAVRSAEGRPLRMLGSVRDVSRQKLAEQRYREAEDRLSLAVESSGLGIWTWDVPTGRVSWSEQCYRIHGLESGSSGRTARSRGSRTGAGRATRAMAGR
jgi:PAS domain S-box-containing protein